MQALKAWMSARSSQDAEATVKARSVDFHKVHKQGVIKRDKLAVTCCNMLLLAVTCAGTSDGIMVII